MSTVSQNWAEVNLQNQSYYPKGLGSIRRMPTERYQYRLFKIIPSDILPQRNKAPSAFYGD